MLTLIAHIALTGVCCLGLPTAWATAVAVDVGHSLARPGAISARGMTEFEFNRGLALALQRALEAHGFKVSLIGAQGDMAELRGRTAAAAEADLFLSIHHDSVQSHYLEDWQPDGERRHFSDRFSGFSLFVSRLNPHLSTSLACASAIGTALRQAGFKPSPHHAELILGENRPFADAPNGVHYFDELVVLKTATQAAVLVEAGIIVNRADELLLREPVTHAKIAAAIAGAVRGCLASQSTWLPGPAVGSNINP